MLGSAVIEGRSDDLAERLEGIRQAAARGSGTRGHAASAAGRPRDNGSGGELH
jgi:hypothetical protein